MEEGRREVRKRREKKEKNSETISFSAGEAVSYNVTEYFSALFQHHLSLFMTLCTFSAVAARFAFLCSLQIQQICNVFYEKSLVYKREKRV